MTTITASVNIDSATYGPEAWHETEFIGNAVGIDPADCGCTDCITGSSIPFNTGNASSLAELAAQVIHGQREFIVRLGGTLNVVRNGDEYGFTDEMRSVVIGNTVAMAFNDQIVMVVNNDEGTSVASTMLTAEQARELGEFLLG